MELNTTRRAGLTIPELMISIALIGVIVSLSVGVTGGSLKNEAQIRTRQEANVVLMAIGRRVVAGDPDLLPDPGTTTLTLSAGTIATIAPNTLPATGSVTRAGTVTYLGGTLQLYTLRVCSVTAPCLETSVTSPGQPEVMP